MIFHLISSKPILLVGNGVRAAGAAELVYEFKKKTNIPVLTTMNGVDLAQDDIHIGFIGTHGNRVANMILNECDLIISVGARLGLRQIGRYKEKFAPNAKLIRADIDQFELSRNIKADEEKYQMDAKDFLSKLLAEDIPNYAGWNLQCEQAKMVLDKYDITEGNLIIKKISELLPENPVISVDVGMHQCWSAQSLHLKGHFGRIHIGGGFGSMGCGLPFAIGSSIANDNGISYCICGDGGIQMNIQELQAIRQENLPVKIFVLNNKVLGKISETQHLKHGDRFAQTAESGGYHAPDFKKISEACGIKSATLESYKELDKYSFWITDNEPCLITIMLPESTRLFPKIKWETGKYDPEIPEEVTQKIVEILSD